MYNTQQFGLTFTAPTMSSDNNDQSRRGDSSESSQEKEELRQMRMQMFDVSNRIALLKSEIAEKEERRAARHERSRRHHRRKKIVRLIWGAVLVLALTAIVLSILLWV